jgi:hypothetical protein
MHRRWLALTAMAWMAVGCAHAPKTPQSEMPKYEHVFQKPLAEALDATRQLLEAQGYTFEPTADPSQLVTAWSQPDRMGSRNNTYTRYVVTGIQLTPRQSVVRVFKMKHETTGNDAEWNKLWWKMYLERGEQSANPFVQEADFVMDDTHSKLLSALRGAQQGTRDLELEQALTLKLESSPSVEVISGDAVASERRTSVRDSDFYLERWQEETRPEGPCPVDVKGLAPLLHPGLTLLIGEQLGSNEVPAMVGHLVCQAASTGLTVVLGLSLPATEQPKVEAYLASPGGPADQDTLLEGRFWTRPYQDGRSSRAVMDLIDRARSLRAAGLRVTVVAYDTDTASGSERDRAQAGVWLKRRQEQPHEVHIVLAGNTHTRVQKGTPWDRDFTPMAHLMKEDRSLFVLETSYAQGRRWGCDLNRESKLVCGVVGATPEARVAAPAGLSPSIRILETPASEGFQGLLYVGQLTPSVPAILGAQEVPSNRPPPPRPTPANHRTYMPN